eukprot:scpid63172/ scgid3752/ Putative serine/threonine-protein kinase/receptor R826
MTTAEESLLQDLGLVRGEIAYLGAFAVRDEDEIGRGSDAVVYRVEWQGIPAAAKVLHSLLVQRGVHGREDKLRRFGAEISNLSRLHHPNLCQTLGIGSTADRGLPALVVELFDRTLHECSIGEGRLDDLTLMSFLEHAIAGVCYLHSNDPPVIHRDLTLRNVLIKGNVAKLADFGVARVTQRHLVGLLPADVLTECPGTQLYMPPEALSELAPAVYNESLDIFSFAVLATSVLTGADPSRNLLNSPRARVVERVDGVCEERVISEVERRQVDLARIPDDHPLRPAIIRGLSNSAEDRPMAEEMHEFVKAAQRLERDLAMNVQDDRAEQRFDAVEGRLQALERTRDAEPVGSEVLDRNQLLDRLAAMERQLERVTMIADRTVSMDERLSKAVASLTHTAEQPHLSNVLPAVVRRLDSISEQLTQQATSITALSTRSDTLEEQLTAAVTNHQTMAQQQLTAITDHQTTAQQQLTATQQQLAAAITNNQTTTQQQLTATQQQLTAIADNQTTTQQHLTATRQQISTVQDEQSSATQRLTEHLDAIAENQTMTQQQLTATEKRLTATQHTIHNEQTTTNRRVQTLADQLRDTNEQTSRQMTTLTDQISAVSGQLSTMSASTHQLQIRPTTAPESLSSSPSATASATTAVAPVSSPIAAQDSRSSSASSSAPAPTSPTATRL